LDVEKRNIYPIHLVWLAVAKRNAGKGREMFAAAAIAANSAGFNVCGNQLTRRSISMRRVTARHRCLAVNNNKKLESESHQNEQQQGALHFSL
jgi:hypothetical protein